VRLQREKSVPLSPVPRRRYARLPRDAMVMRDMEEWAEICTVDGAMALLLPRLDWGDNLTVGMWHYTHYACLTTAQPIMPIGINAVSAWGKKTSADALVSLAFKWAVLMGESWHPDDWVQPVMQTTREDA